MNTTVMLRTEIKIFSLFSSYFLRLVGDWFVWLSLFAIKKIVEEYGVEHTQAAFLSQASTPTNLVLLMFF
jgi:hypothetical protein